MKFTEILRAFHAVVQLYPKTSQVGMGFSLDVRVPEKNKRRAHIGKSFVFTITNFFLAKSFKKYQVWVLQLEVTYTGTTLQLYECQSKAEKL